MNIVIEAIGFGIVSATLLVFGAGAFSLQYGLSHVFNLAFGSIMMVSAFAAYAAVQRGWGLITGLVVAALTGSILSTAINSFVYRPFARRGAGLFNIAFVAFALGTILQYGLALVFGENSVSISPSAASPYHIAGMVFLPIELEFLALAAIFFTGLELLLRLTRLGKAIRATASDPSLARACGISVTRVADFSWMLSGAMCGIAGFYYAIQLGSFSFISGQALFPVILAAAMVGGVGNPSGAVRGSLLVGVSTEVLAAVTNPALKQVYAFAILLVVLIVRRRDLLRSMSEQAVAT